MLPPGYNPCHCGANCMYFDDADEPPCWGAVNPIDVPYGDDFWIHACEGHYSKASGDGDGKYILPRELKTDDTK